MAFLIIICVGTAIYCFMSGMPVAGLLALGGMIRGVGFVTLIAVIVILFLNGKVIPAFFPAYIVISTISGLLVEIRSFKENYAKAEERQEKKLESLLHDTVGQENTEKNYNAFIGGMDKAGYMRDSLQIGKKAHKKQPARGYGDSSDSVESSWKGEQLIVAGNRTEIIQIIEAIDSDSEGVPVKDKARVVEFVGGSVSWNDKEDPSKGCVITLDQVERVFHDSKSLDTWIKGVALPRIKECLNT